MPASSRAARRTLVIRHASGHRIVALLEIVSPANKDRASHVSEFVDKAESALAHGIHLLLIDLLAPGPFDPSGMHGALWERFADEPFPAFKDEPLTLASYIAGQVPEAYIERLSVGNALAAMPLFLNPQRYVSIPLESTYMQAFRGLPGVGGRFWNKERLARFGRLGCRWVRRWLMCSESLWIFSAVSKAQLIHQLFEGNLTQPSKLD
jgi:hypothetical protein